MPEPRLILITFLLLSLAAAPGRVAAQAQPAREPTGEVVRILRTVWIEGGESVQDVHNPQAVVPNPTYQAWAMWAPGTRVIVRADEVDARGRAYPVERRIFALEAIDGTSLRVSQRRVEAGGVPGEATVQEHPARITRDVLLVPRRPATMIYWQRLDAIVAFDVPPPAGAQDRPRARRSRRAREPARDPAEPLPAQFDCTILEMAYIDESPVEEGVPLPDDAVVVWRAFLNIHLPGAQPILEQWRGRLDERGQPADLQLVMRWRIERVLRPGQPDPTPEQLAEGLPLDG